MLRAVPMTRNRQTRHVVTTGPKRKRNDCGIIYTNQQLEKSDVLNDELCSFPSAQNAPADLLYDELMSI